MVVKAWNDYNGNPWNSEGDRQLFFATKFTSNERPGQNLSDLNNTALLSDENVRRDRFVFNETSKLQFIQKSFGKCVGLLIPVLGNIGVMVIELLITFSAPLRDVDRDVVPATIQQNSSALRDASEELKNDRNAVLAAVQQDGSELQYAGEELKTPVNMLKNVALNKRPPPRSKSQ